jgi:aryl-alcohol dehydrogenase-like predicted oxidoreductase
MRYVELGSTGFPISPPVLGYMRIGTPARGNQAWTLEENASRPFI